MAKNKIRTLEQIKAAKAAANAPRTLEQNVEFLNTNNQSSQPLAAEPPSGRTTRRRSSAGTAPVRPKAPNQPATAKPVPSPTARATAKAVVRRPVSGSATARPSKPVTKPSAVQKVKPKSVAVTPKGVQPAQELKKALRPWSATDSNWGTRSESQWSELSDRMHSWVQDNKGLRTQDLEDMIRREMGLSSGDTSQFVEHARRGAPRNKLFHYGVPHAGGREGLWSAMMTGSGRPTSAGNGSQVHATDLFTTVDKFDDTLIDVQDTFRGKDLTTIGIYKNLQDGVSAEVLANNPNATLSEIAKKTANRSGRFGNDKLTQTDRGLAGTLPRDRNMRTEFGRYGEPTYRKDYLVGGTYAGEMEFDPKMFDKGYAADLDTLRGNILGQTPDQLRNRGIRINASRNNLGIDIPIKELKELGDGKGSLAHLVSPEMQRAVREQGGDFYAGLPINGQQARNLAKGAGRNWRGGLSNTLLSGASRETGKALGRGDLRGAATEFGKEYAIGAVGETALRGAAKSKIGQRIATAVSRRAAPALARWGAGTGGSGGLLAPVMTAITAVDLADGVVEGFTGKGTLDHAADNVRDTYTRTTGDKRTDAEITSNLTGPKTPYQPKKVGGTPLTASAAEKASAFLEKSTGVKATPAPVASITPGPGPSTDTVSVPQKENWAQSLDRGMTWMWKKAGF